MIRPLVLVLALFVFPVASAQDFRVLYEQRVQTPAATSRKSTRTNPAIASRGSEALAVWNDYRTGDRTLFATRLDSHGEIVDPFGILIDDEYVVDPRVAWNGSHYIVTGKSADVLGAHRVAADGTVIGKPAILGRISSPALASNGSAIALGGRTSAGGVFALLDAQGNIRAQTSVGNALQVLPVADGSAWMAFVIDSSNVYLCTFDANAQLLKKTHVTGSVFSSAAVATNGNGRFLLAWTDYRWLEGETYLLETWNTIVDRDGKQEARFPQVLERQPVQISRSTRTWGGTTRRPPAVLWDGTRFLVAWNWFNGDDQTAMHAAIVQDNGDAGTPMKFGAFQTRDLYTAAVGPAAAITDSRIHLVWGDAFARPPFTYGLGVAVMHRAVASAAELAQDEPPHAVSTESESQSAAGFIAGDKSMLVMWREEYEGGTALRARMLRYAGGASPAFTISTGTPVFNGTRSIAGSAAVWAGGLFLIAWREADMSSQSALYASHLFVRRYDAAGSPVDSAPIELSTEGVRSGWVSLGVSAAFDGSQVLLTWPNSETHALQGLRITPAGERIDASPLSLFDSPGTPAGSPRAIWTGSEFVIVWYHDQNPQSFAQGDAGRLTRLSRDGRVLDTGHPTLVTLPASNTVVGRSSFDVTTDGRNLLVTWLLIYQENPSVAVSTRSTCGYGQRFSLEGAPIDAAPFNLGCHDGTAAGFSMQMIGGERWLIVSNNGIFAVRTRDGLPEGPPILLVDGKNAAHGTSVITTPIGMFLGYQRYDPASGANAVFVARLGTARARAVRR